MKAKPCAPGLMALSLGAARGKMNRLQGTAANMAVAGYAAKATGSHILGDISETLDESKKFEVEAMRIKALGLGDHATADALKYVKAMKSYGTSTTDNLTLMRDSMTIFADEHHAQMVMPTLAKMKFANEALFGAEDGHANEEKFMNMLKGDRAARRHERRSDVQRRSEHGSKSHHGHWRPCGRRPVDAVHSNRRRCGEANAQRCVL